VKTFTGETITLAVKATETIDTVMAGISESMMSAARMVRMVCSPWQKGAFTNQR
jgi:hypothetical protein